MLVLYLRSRGVPAALATLVLVTVGVWALDSRAVEILLLTVAMGVAVTSAGLAGADVQLDRTGAIPWPLWRATHLVMVGLAVFGLVTAVDLWDMSVVLRDTAGLAGLTGLATAVLGNQLAWTLPALWVAVCIVGQPDNEALMWLAQSADSTPAVVMASVLGTVGLAAYALTGPRGT
ncbi:hypothetical protein LWC34_03315 [Kibdelosporangium philippinense]|uniref:Uncharacterized protein n=1 Tax=Kibdelosporangium philippinense TaxID=211113 RepID=A0ABS8Z4I8_9PSEU|nr:hypothetical protein [Kibdelosporangium philippinense]MCE7001869.1 hypothetical protein [Kibdelosporangium philippinense]